MNRPITAALASAALAFTLAGCGTAAPTGATTADPAATTEPTAVPDDSPTEEAPTEEPTEEETPEEEEQPDVVAFGQTYKYEDGIELTISAPKKFKPSEYAAGAEGPGTAVKFMVTVKNNTSQVYDPTLFHATVSSGEAESESIFDDEVGGSPNTKVLKGKTVKFQIGYKVLNVKDITMEANPGMFDYEAAIYSTNP